jgi:heptosyltransferase I
MPRASNDLRSLQPQRVCVIKPSAMGDVVTALPVAASLRSLWPHAHIAWVVNRSLRALLDGNPDLDEVIPFDRAHANASWTGLTSIAAFLSALRRRRFDVAIDLQGLLRSGVMAWATGAKIRVGLADAREGASWFYSHHIPMPAEPTNIVDRLLRVAAAFGGQIASPTFRVASSSEDDQWAREALSPLPRPRLVLNMGARWLTKRWPVANFAEIARRALNSFGAGIVVVGAPEDRPLVEDFRYRLDSSVEFLDLCGLTTFPKLAAVASRSDLFLSNDSGPLHLAAAGGARVLGIYTCTDPRRTGPYGARAAVVQSSVWCAASCVKSCDRMECMTELTVDRVWIAVQNVLRNEADWQPTAA